MATNQSRTVDHSLHPTDDTADAMATYLVREHGRSVAGALPEAVQVIAVLGGFTRWLNEQSNEQPERSVDVESVGLAQLDVPPGFDYFEASAQHPVVDAAPAWQHLDTPSPTNPTPPSPHAGIVELPADIVTKAAEKRAMIAIVVAAASAAAGFLAAHHDQTVLAQMLLVAAGIVMATVFFQAGILRGASRVRRLALDCLLEHETRAGARAVREQMEANDFGEHAPGS